MSYVTYNEGFDAMRLFLERYWKRGGSISDDIAILLGSLDRLSDAIPLDEAQWHDWVKACRDVTSRSKSGDTVPN